jgi:hypothetical protein
VIDLPSLECVCHYSIASSFSSDREQGGDASSRGGTCRAGDQASWIFSVSGLVPGFLYKLRFKWSLEDDLLEALDLSISTTTSSYAVRTPLAESGQNGTSTFDLIAHSRKLRMDVAVWDVYPGLTEEEALIGARHMDSAVNTVRVLCTNVTPPSPQSVTPSLRTASTIEQHGLDHPAVVIDFPALECACDYSNTSYISSDRERGGDASSRGGTCRAGDQLSWIFSVSGLVPGFLYRLHFEWSLEDWQQGALDLNISTTTSSYAVRTPLAESGQTDTSTFDLISHSRKLCMDVAAWDMHPGLTEEEALIGARHMDSAVNTVRVRCTDLSGVAWRENTSAWVDTDFENLERTRASLNVSQVGMAKDDNEDLPIGNKVCTLFVPFETFYSSMHQCCRIRSNTGGGAVRTYKKSWGPYTAQYFIREEFSTRNGNRTAFMHGRFLYSYF